VAEKALGYLSAHQVLFDLNSASPRTKAGCGEALAARGLAYVEGAVMAPVAEPGIRVSILAGGAQAMDVAERLNPRGMAIRVVSDTIGRASATKLCRSIMIKGIEALIIDSARASAAWGVSEDVFASLGATFPGQDWAQLARLMDSRVARHGIRRAAEMREAAQMLAELGLSPSLSEAIAEAHERRVLQPPAE
jgi:3-hydroxyisobutyrate dehydrogenase-like beta-hydroxyacid dehydrogenase